MTQPDTFDQDERQRGYSDADTVFTIRGAAGLRQEYEVVAANHPHPDDASYLAGIRAFMDEWGVTDNKVVEAHQFPGVKDNS